MDKNRQRQLQILRSKRNNPPKRPRTSVVNGVVRHSQPIYQKNNSQHLTAPTLSQLKLFQAKRILEQRRQLLARKISANPENYQVLGIESAIKPKPPANPPPQPQPNKDKKQTGCGGCRRKGR